MNVYDRRLIYLNEKTKHINISLNESNNKNDFLIAENQKKQNKIEELEQSLSELEGFEFKYFELKDKLKETINANDILQQTMDQLNNQKNMINAYMKIYKNKIVENRISFQQEIYSKNEIIQKLQKNVEFECYKKKHCLILEQFALLSKLNASIQLENNKLIDEQIVTDDIYQELNIKHQSMIETCDKRSKSLFNAILIGSCYKYKNEILEKEYNELSHISSHTANISQLAEENGSLQQEVSKLQLVIDSNKIETKNDLLKYNELQNKYNQTIIEISKSNSNNQINELNNQIDELKQFKENIQSDQTGLMLESLQANNTIQHLIKENQELKYKLNHYNNKNKTNKCCNNPEHEKQIKLLQRKFDLMCLNIEKVQIESYQFVQKAMSLRDSNIKLKKKNRKVYREMKRLQEELLELKSRSQSQWSLNTSCVESVASNHGIYYDVDGNVMSLDELKIIIDDTQNELNDKQLEQITFTNKSINELNERLNNCSKNIQNLKLKNVSSNSVNIKNILSQIMNFSDNILNDMENQFESKLTLYSMRCDEVTRNIRLIKYVLNNKQNEDNKYILNQQNIIHKQLYELQFKIKILKQTFNHQTIENIKHVLNKYNSEYKSFKSTITHSFELTIKKYTQSINVKNKIINELKELLSKRKNENSSMSNTVIEHIELNQKNADKIQCLTKQNNDIKNEFNKLKQEYNNINLNKSELTKQNDLLQKQLINLKETKHEYEQKLNDSNKLKEEFNQILANNQSLKYGLIDSQKEIKEKAIKYEEMKKEYDELMKSMNVLKEEMTEIKIQLKVCESSKGNNKKEKQQLLSENKQIKDQLNEHVAEKSKLQQQLEDLQSKLSKYNELQQEYDQIITTIPLFKEQISELKIKLEIAKSNAEDDNITQQEMLSEYNDAKKKLDEIIINKSKLQKQNELLHKEMEQKELKYTEIQRDLTSTIESLQDEISSLQTKVKTLQSNQDEINKNKKNKLNKLIHELKETKKERNKYFNDKQLLQQEMKLVNKQLDDLTNSKEKWMSQMNQLMEYQKNTSQLSQKMQEYAQMTAGNEQRIQTLESMKTTLEKDNITQLQEMQKVFAENESLKKENKEQQDKIDEMDVIVRNQKTKINELVSNDEIQKLKQENQQQSSNIHQLQNMIELSNLETEELKSTIITLKDTIHEQKEQTANDYVILSSSQSKIDDIINQNKDLKLINHSLKSELNECENQVSILTNKIKHKLKSIKKQYDDKLNELKKANKIISELNSKKCELENNLQINKIEIIEKDEFIKELESKINSIESASSIRDSMINNKLNILSNTIQHKLQKASIIINDKQNEIYRLYNILSFESENIYIIKELKSKLDVEICAKMQTQDENQMLTLLKQKLESQIEELNQNLNQIHSKHRASKQSIAKSNGENEQLIKIIKDLRKEIFDLHHSLKYVKHENVQITRYREHLKSKYDELEARLLRYKEKFKSAYSECTLLRKKTTVLDQLLRLTDNEISKLQFDNQSSNVREKMLSDLVEQMNGQEIEPLCDAYNTLSLKINNVNDDNNDNDNNESNEYIKIINSMKRRTDDLIEQCNYYKQMIQLSDLYKMDLKQQTALFAHQILENWQGVFDKITSIVNIKSYTIEILQKSVNDIISINKDNENINYRVAMHAMQDKIRKLDISHKKEQIELRGLLDRELNLGKTQKKCMEKEVNFYREKLQSFYKKYHRKNEQKEQLKLEKYIDSMRHEMNELNQQNVTMATVTNGLREIVREHSEETDKLKKQNISMYNDILEICKFMEDISGEIIIDDNDKQVFNSHENLSKILSIVKQRTLSISSSRSSLHQQEDRQINDIDIDHDTDNDIDDDGYHVIIHQHNDDNTSNDNHCNICLQQFNQMVYKYKCTQCNNNICSLCSEKCRKNTNKKEKHRICSKCVPSK